MIGTPEKLSQYLWQLDKNKKYEIKEYKKKEASIQMLMRGN